MRGAVVIAAKDLLHSLRDRSAIIMGVAAPLVLAFVLSTVLGGAAGEDLDFEFAVVDHDGGPMADAFETGVLAALERDGIATITSESSSRKVDDMARDRELTAAFILPEGLSDGVQSGRAARIEVVTDPESDIATQVARSVAQGFADEINAIQVSVGTALASAGAAPDPRLIARLQQRARSLASPIAVSEGRAGSRQFDDNTFFAAGMAVFFLFLTAQLGAVSLLRERREGTLARLLAAPISRRTILLAKGLFGFVLGATSVTVLVIATTLLLDAHWGDPLGVALMISGGVFAAVGLQSFVATLAKTDEQAAGYGSIVGVTLGLLGGTFFPLSQGPGLLAKLSLVTPHAWLMRGLGELSGGAAGALDVVPAVVALAAFGAVTGTAGFLRARSVVAR